MHDDDPALGGGEQPAALASPPGRSPGLRRFERWPDGYQTEASWKYGTEQERRVRKGERPSHVRIEDRDIPVFHISQVYFPRRRPNELQVARHEFLRRFWFPARHDKYLFCDDGTATIDYHAQRAKGVEVPWFTEGLVVQHLRGESVYGTFAQQSFPRRPARTYYVALDLDLHLNTGGNLGLFREQVGAVLGHFWGRLGCQVVVSAEKLNGLHVYLFFDEPVSLEKARLCMQAELVRLHEKHPDLARRVAEWNMHLKASHPGKTWRVRQIDDLEIYPDETHGFRFIGTRGKVVLADREIGTAKWGVSTRGRRKGEDIIGFDVVSWWRAMQTGERMPLDEVLRIFESRLPERIEPPVGNLVVRIGDKDDPPVLAVRPGTDPVERPESVGVTSGSDPEGLAVQPRMGALYRQTRRKITGFWMGTYNPKGWFETAVIVTARLVWAEGLTEEEAAALLGRYAREIPEEARHCSTRLLAEDWGRIDRDITKAVRNAYGGGKRYDANRSDAELGMTIRAWARLGFRMSDKTTWGCSGMAAPEEVKIEWIEADRKDIRLWLMPALKIDDVPLAVDVATAVVLLTAAKDREERGWGYEYLKKWLPDNFGIPCSKRSKLAAVFQSLEDLRIIRVLHPARKGRATRWAFGARVEARLAGDVTEQWKVVEDEDAAEERRERKRRLLFPCESDEWGLDEGGEVGMGSTLLCSLFTHFDIRSSAC